MASKAACNIHQHDTFAANACLPMALDLEKTTQMAAEEVARISSSLAATAAEILECQTGQERSACVAKAMHNYEKAVQWIQVIVPHVESSEAEAVADRHASHRATARSRPTGPQNGKSSPVPELRRPAMSAPTAPAPSWPVEAMPAGQPLEQSGARLLPPPPSHPPNLSPVGRLQPLQQQQGNQTFGMDSVGSWSNRSSAASLDTPTLSHQSAHCTPNFHLEGAASWSHPGAGNIPNAGTMPNMSFMQQQQPQQQAPQQQPQQLPQHPQQILVNQLQQALRLSEIMPPPANGMSGMSGMPALPTGSPQLQMHNMQSQQPMPSMPDMRNATQLMAQSMQTVQQSMANMQSTQPMQNAMQGMQNAQSMAGMQNAQSMTGMQNAQSMAGMQNAQSMAGMQNVQSMAGMQNAQSMAGMQNSQSMAGMQNQQSMPGMQNTSSMEGMQSNYLGNQVQVIALPIGAPPPPGTILAAGPAPADASAMSSAGPGQFQAVNEDYFPPDLCQVANARKFQIVNPRTGEEVQAPSENDKNTKRLRIVNPGTGKEVLPGNSDKENADFGFALEGQQYSAGGPLQEANYNSILEDEGKKHIGESWDWPLSRTEIRGRIESLNEELLAQ